MCAKSKNVGLRLGLRLGMRLESWVYDWVCDWEPPDLPPSRCPPVTYPPPLLSSPFPSGRPSSSFAMFPERAPFSMFAKTPGADAPPRFFSKLPERTPLPDFAKFPVRTPLLAFCKLPERTPLPSQCLQHANRHSGVCEKNARAYSAERKVQLPPRPQLQCWTSDATHGRAEAGVFFAAPQRPPAATTTLNLGVRGSLRQCA